MASYDQLLRVIRIQSDIAKLGLDLGGVMQHVVEETLPLLDADGAVIELAEGQDMVYRAASGIASDQLGLRLDADRSLSGLCVATGDVVYCDDSETDPRVDRHACRKVGLRSMIVMPLQHHGVSVGALKAMSAEPGKFGQQDITLLTMLSDVVAAAMYFSVQYDSDGLFFQATHDCMTGLANRALFMDRLRNVIARAHRESNRHSGLLMIDLDGLKQTNDTYGHRVGDAIIIEFCNRLKNAIRDTDTAARLGGDEFGVILTPLDGEDGANSTVRRIDAEFESPFLFENKQYDLKASIGMALVPGDGLQPEEILDVADKRMYAMKRSRKKC